MYKIEKHGKGGIVARIVADSINGAGDRITTFELEYHRFIHSEIMTHRLFSRNAMSSRAVPVSKMIEQVSNSPATPIYWGKNKSGMQADEECSEQVFMYPMDTNCLDDCDYGTNEEAWCNAANNAVVAAMYFNKAGYHKQIVNRLLEPFQMMKTVITATEFENFFWLRLDSDAQPEIRELAKCMCDCMEESNPELLNAGEWHTPYVKHQRNLDGKLLYIVNKNEDNAVYVSEEEAIAISSSASAQVSYRNIDNTLDKAMKVYDRLGVGGAKLHASPFEHPCKVMKNCSYNKPVATWEEMFEEGVTHVDKNGDFWSGNVKGWIQHRQLLANNTKW